MSKVWPSPALAFEPYTFAGTHGDDLTVAADMAVIVRERRHKALRIRQSGLPIHRSGDELDLPRLTWRRRVSLHVKRAMDVAGALFGLLALSPMLTIVAIAIKLTDKGPVFFRQQRVGLNGSSFEIYKFRSMYADRGDSSGIIQTVANDTRVTPIGRFLRRTSIDELPQLINVLRGEMSLVGPRPHVAGMIAAGVPYEELSPDYAYRYLMRPGITGWAQCNRFRGTTVHETQALSRLGHDIAYIQNYSLMLDLKVIWLTLRQEFISGSAI